MNLFNPKGQKLDSSVTYEVTEARDGTTLVNYSPTRASATSIA